MNVAILGGSFNPPHICHVFILHYIAMTSDADQIWLLPCYQHAFGKFLAAFYHRFTMCSLAVESFRPDLVQVLPFEQERQGTSWTIDTVRYVKQRFPEHDFSWIIGSDVLYELEKWKDFDLLQQLISFLIVPRAIGVRTSMSAFGARASCPQPHDGQNVRAPGVSIIHELETQCEKLKLQGIQLPAVSSSLIRERLKQKLSIGHLVPQKVEKYIDRHGLYRS